MSNLDKNAVRLATRLQFRLCKPSTLRSLTQWISSLKKVWRRSSIVTMLEVCKLLPEMSYSCSQRSKQWPVDQKNEFFTNLEVYINSESSLFISGVCELSSLERTFCSSSRHCSIICINSSCHAHMSPLWIVSLCTVECLLLLSHAWFCFVSEKAGLYSSILSQAKSSAP